VCAARRQPGVNTMGQDLSNLSLVSLFRAEATVHAATLCQGLLDPPADPGQAGPWFEGLMRAGHSLKGAARIVGLELLVGLAHALEDRIVRDQQLGQWCDGPHVDAMLEAADIFAEVAVREDDEVQPWLDQHASRIQRLQTQIMAHAVAAPAPAAVDMACNTAVPAEAPAKVGPAQVAAAPAPTPAASSSGAGANRVVKLAAQTLDDMLTQAREALLVDEAREREAQDLQRFSRRWRQSMSALDQVIARLGQRATMDSTVQAVVSDLSDLRQGMGVNQDLLAALSVSHDRHIRRGRLAARQLYQSVRRTRMTTLDGAILAWRRQVHDLGRRLGRPIELSVHGQHTLIDRDVLDRIESPLNHLLGNAADHGLESVEERVAAGKPAAGQITVRARHVKGQLLLEVSDDGRGINLDALRQRVQERGLASPEVAQRLSDAELYEFLFLPGFSTRSAVSDISGRGVGLDVVRTQVQALGGAVRVSSSLGQGSRFVLALPISVSVLRVLLVQVDAEVYAIGLQDIERVERLSAADLLPMGAQTCAHINRAVMPVVSLASQLGLPAAPAGDHFAVVVVGEAEQARALRVDALLGERNIGLMPLDPRLGGLRHVAAAAILDDGTPVLVLDAHRLGHDQEHGLSNVISEASPQPNPRKRVLVVEDSFTVREVERQVLTAAGYEVDARVDGEDGWQGLMAGHFDLMITDIDMPKLNGIDLLRRVRALPAHRELPVMIVSYKDSAADRKAGLDAGADRYFVKSGFDDRSLLAAVADLIGEP
jgi:two-component system, chemotaxis family, sensor histidine kinase and response regulator WspE